MSNTLSVVKKHDLIRILDRAAFESRLQNASPDPSSSDLPAVELAGEAVHVALKFEILGWGVTAAVMLPTMRLPPLVRMTPESVSKLPELKDLTGWYFPSAIVSGGLPCAPEGYFFVERDSYPRYFLDLNQTFDAFMATKSAKTRSTLRRKLRKFEAASDGPIDWRVYRSPEELLEFHDLAIGLARRTYQARLYDAALPDDMEFRREMMALAANGQVAAFLLFLHGAPVAYLYAPIVDRRIIYGFLGFDSEHAKLSPGTVLQLLAMQWCFDRSDLDLFDFTEGDGAHKALFSSYSRPCADLILLRKRVGLRLIAALYRLSRAISGATSEMLERLGVKNRIRGWLHRSAHMPAWTPPERS